MKDHLNRFSNLQAITVTAASEDVVDGGVTNPNLGEGEDIDLDILVATAFTAAGAATLVIAVEDSADNATYAVLVQTKPIPVADLVADYFLKLKVPRAHRRYLRIYFTVATGPMTAGTLSAAMDAL